MAIFNASKCRVFINGHEISGLVHGLEIEARVGEIMRTRLELYTDVTMSKDGSIYIGGEPRIVEMDHNFRAIKVE